LAIGSGAWPGSSRDRPHATDGEAIFFVGECDPLDLPLEFNPLKNLSCRADYITEWKKRGFDHKRAERLFFLMPCCHMIQAGRVGRKSRWKKRKPRALYPVIWFF
jgi:hypothetical protein